MRTPSAVRFCPPRVYILFPSLVADALRADDRWGEVDLEVAVGEDAVRSKRPDLCAVRVGSGARTWGDVSVTSPLCVEVARRVAAVPRRPMAAAAREAAKVKHYASALPPADPPSTFTPLVWEGYGRVGEATADWLAAALGGPAAGPALATLMRRVSVALWRHNARSTLAGLRASTPAGSAALSAPAADNEGLHCFARLSG